MFGRATIRLGIGPHSSYLYIIRISPFSCCWHAFCHALINEYLYMVALCNRADDYIFILFLSFLLLFFSSPNLSSRRLDVYHTLAHGVALVRI